MSSSHVYAVAFIVFPAEGQGGSVVLEKLLQGKRILGHAATLVVPLCLQLQSAPFLRYTLDIAATALIQTIPSPSRTKPIVGAGTYAGERA